MIDPGLETLDEPRCPDCGKTHFLRGPSGGLSRNIECAACGQRFNVARPRVNGQPTLVAAQRIPYTGIWPDRGDWP